jgi:hypothetical protein
MQTDVTNTQQIINNIFQWIPSHIGPMGNETADLAKKKKGSRMTSNQDYLEHNYL